jgi:predicted P-loop ATPase
MSNGTKPTSNNPILAAALQYAEQGLPVFSCKNEPADPKQHKKPLTKHGFKDATTDRGIIHRWWQRHPTALIGMPTGKVTGIAVLDLDRKNDKDGFVAVPEWERRTPVITRTPSGGAHLYFKTYDGLRCTESVIAPGVDTRAEGGYVIVPPSPGYAWVGGADLSALPPWPDDLRVPERHNLERKTVGKPEAELALVAAALEVIPNEDLGWGEWNRIGMATWAATNGSDEGLAAFQAWSSKSKKHNSNTTAERWEHFAKSPPRQIGAGTLFYEASQVDPSWRARAAAAMQFPDISKEGGLRRSLPNTKVALTKLGVECRHDLFKLRHLIEGHELENFIGDVSDPALLRLRELIYERFGFDPTTETVHTAVLTLANHHRFHPVRDYLDGLHWDGTQRIDSWLINYGGAEDSEYTRAVGALVLIAAVRRVRTPGCKFDEMLVLENPEQGTNKSTALQVLAVEREWFSDNLPLGLNGKETIEALSGHWILEVSELQGMKKSEIEKVKAFLSRDTDRARMAYARTVTEARRQCVIIGTTNSEKYLRDLTGNRRIWPVRVERFDLEGLKRDRDQLWAEAAAREASGTSIRLPEHLWAAAAAEQRERVIDNPFLSVLERALREVEISEPEVRDDTGRILKRAKRVPGSPMRGKIAAEDVWTLLGIRPGQRHQDHNEKLGAAMAELGWKRTRLRINGELSYSYVRGDEPYRRIVVYPGDKDSPATAHYGDEGGPEAQGGPAF